ncbi:hypothetical protein DXG01_015147 [Tephrocybe rancida]|nr:hypothetical protein DXG01_015147 [Tephrocybe rancida]
MVSVERSMNFKFMDEELTTLLEGELDSFLDTELVYEQPALPTPSHKATVEDVPDEAPENELLANPPPPPAPLAPPPPDNVKPIAPAAPEGRGCQV